MNGKLVYFQRERERETNSVATKLVMEGRYINQQTYIGQEVFRYKLHFHVRPNFATDSQSRYAQSSSSAH